MPVSTSVQGDWQCHRTDGWRSGGEHDRCSNHRGQARSLGVLTSFALNLSAISVRSNALFILIPEAMSRGPMRRGEGLVSELDSGCDPNCFGPGAVGPSLHSSVSYGRQGRQGVSDPHKVIVFYMNLRRVSI